jgi:23S rRNA pseudouridine2605 synthase
VRVDGRIVRELGRRVHPERDVIEVDGARVGRAERVYLALNKLRGHVTTRDDPQGRPTVYASLGRATLPFVAPVGRLDRASEGLLLLTNDSQWAARLLDPAAHVDKTYHVQVRAVADEALVARVAAGVTEPSSGERLAVKAVTVLRVGSRSSAWLEIVLDEGRTDTSAVCCTRWDVEVLRLVRVAIGPLGLGALPKGAWRLLTPPRCGPVAPAVTGAGRARDDAVPFASGAMRDGRTGYPRPHALPRRPGGRHDEHEGRRARPAALPPRRARAAHRVAELRGDVDVRDERGGRVVFASSCGEQPIRSHVHPPPANPPIHARPRRPLPGGLQRVRRPGHARAAAPGRHVRERERRPGHGQRSRRRRVPRPGRTRRDALHRAPADGARVQGDRRSGRRRRRHRLRRRPRRGPRPELRAGQTLQLTGRSTFHVRDGRLVRIVDES